MRRNGADLRLFLACLDGRDWARKASMARFVARSKPRLMSTALAPAIAYAMAASD
jgi:hypothetical protein